jgi:hypothetical protein
MIYFFNNTIPLLNHQESLNGYQPETKLKGGKAMRTFSLIK